MKYKNQDSSWLGLLTRTTSETVADVVATIGYAIIASVVVFSLPAGSPARALVAIPLVFFLPGYALVSALYPGRPVERSDTVASLGESLRGLRLGWQTRLALAVGSSVAILPILAVALSLLGVQSTPAVRTLVLNLVIVVGMALALWRRFKLSERDQFRVPYRAWLDWFYGIGHNQSRSRQLLVVVVLLLSTASLVGLGGAIVTDQSAESYTTLMLLTEADGEYVAGDYPTELTAGESASLVVGVANHEDRPRSYTIVPVVQRVDPGGETVTVREQTRLDPMAVEVPPGETQYVPHEVSPSLQGESVRLVYLLYRGAAPADPSVESSYRHTHLWLNVSAEG